MTDFILGLLDVSVILALFLWGDIFVKVILGKINWEGNAQRFIGFIIIILLLSLLHEKIAQFILNLFDKQIAWGIFLIVLVGAWIDYRKKY